MKSIVVAANDFNLALTLDSGQTFHWERCGDGFAGMIGERAVYVEQRGARLFVSRGAEKIASHYFALDHPLAEIRATLPRDAAMDAARKFCRGMRIMRQPKWECLATFICSSMKQVAHIRQMSAALRRRHGQRREVAGVELYSFPSAARIAETSEAELRACALGYRAKNLLATARVVATGEADLEGWSKLDDNELRARLCALPGVGAKVAHCTMLFAYERLRAFPIDVWIERVLREKYFPRRRKFRAGELQKFSARYFGEQGGYAQQYLFHHARVGSRRKE